MMCLILWTTLAGFVAPSNGAPQDYVQSATTPHVEVITDNASEVFNISVPSTSLPDPQVGESYQSVPYSLSSNSTTEYEGATTVRTLEQTCDNLETSCKREDITTVPPQPSAPTKRTCGNRKKGSLEITWAEYAEFPWMVGVLRLPTDVSLGLEYLCGGSLIHPQVVLTAAHCVKVKDNLMVRVGEWDTRTDIETYPSPDIKVRQVQTHEQFEERTLNNGVALLILEQPVNMSFPNVGLICLPEANENMDNRDCVASGWGKDKFGKNSEILKRVDGLPMVPRSRCQEALRNATILGPSFRLHESFVCAGGIPGKDMCKWWGKEYPQQRSGGSVTGFSTVMETGDPSARIGWSGNYTTAVKQLPNWQKHLHGGDGGSPLVCPSKNDPDVYVQAGIVSWGIDCNTETPGVYTNVPHFVNWIENKLQATVF